MKKRFIAILLTMILAISTIGIMTANAGISGKSEVYAGETYNFTVSKSASASSISGNISWSGFASGSETMWEDSSSAMSESITASKTISISVPAGTPAGSTCTISVSGQISTFDGTNVGESGYSDSKTITVVDRPASTPKPERTSKPSSNKTENSKTESEPTPTPEPTAWQLASEEVDGMEQGGTITVELTGEDDDHEIPVEIYNTLREKKGKLTMNFGTYSCTLDGAALGELDEEEDELDLGLSFEGDEEYSAAVGGNDVYQLHFSHKGEFPGKISFTFKADKNSPGDTVYLYYYYSTSKVIAGIQSAVVDENGFVTFDIYHCSSYFVASALVEGAAGIVTQAEPEPTPTPEPTAEPTPDPTPTPEPEPNPLTAEPQTNGFPLAVLIAVGIGAALLAVLFTMIVFRVGLFSKKRTRHSEF